MGETFKKSLAFMLRQLFVNRADCYCMQNKDGSYAKIEAPLTNDVIDCHLNGGVTVGAYQLGKDNAVKYLCFDFDLEKFADPREAVAKLLYTLFEMKEEEPGKKRPRVWPYAVMLEASRYPDPSFHVWIFFEPTVPAKVARWLGLRILELVGLNPKLVEVFPKQTELTRDRPFGNFVKLPCGLHRVEQKWSRILDHETFAPMPTEALLKFWGICFSEVDLAKIEGFERKTSVQSAFSLPAKFKPLSDKEEEKAVKFLCKYWKPKHRNQLEMCFLGLCLKKGVSYESAKHIIEEVTLRTNDEEHYSRLLLVDYHYHNRLNVALKGSSGIREILEEMKSEFK